MGKRAWLPRAASKKMKPCGSILADKRDRPAKREPDRGVVPRIGRGIAASNRVLLLAGCWGMLLPAAASANIGPRWWGDRTAEPLGLKGVAITREKLTIDLRPLAAVQPVEVEAIYHLNNPGSAKHLDLLFITGVAGVSDFQVQLNDRMIPSTRSPLSEHADQLPKSWQPPERLPGIYGEIPDGRTHLALGERIVLAFSIELPPGASTLQARYRARASGIDEQYPTVTWQFPYVLAPAREWQSFGGMDVTVFVPEGWQASSVPGLERDGDVLRGSSSSALLLPDCLVLAVRAPLQPELERIVLRYDILYVLGLMSGGVPCWWAGRLLGWLLSRKAEQRTTLWIGLVAFVAAIGWPALILWIFDLARHDIYGLLAGQESPYFHERFYLPKGITLLLLPLLFSAGFWLTWRGARKYVVSSRSASES